MKINGPRKLVRRAVHAACLLDVYDFELNIQYHDEGSNCSRNESGSFEIRICRQTPKFLLVEHVAHEMVHLRQYQTGRLRDHSETHAIWDDEICPYGVFMSDEYWLTPWELEARSLEDWITHKWENRKSELH